MTNFVHSSWLFPNSVTYSSPELAAHTKKDTTSYFFIERRVKRVAVQTRATCNMEQSVVRLGEGGYGSYHHIGRA